MRPRRAGPSKTTKNAWFRSCLRTGRTWRGIAVLLRDCERTGPVNICCTCSCTLGCGCLLHETALRARLAELADPSAVASWNRLKNRRGLAACSMRGVVPISGGACGLRSQIPERRDPVRVERPWLCRARRSGEARKHEVICCSAGMSWHGRRCSSVQPCAKASCGFSAAEAVQTSRNASQADSSCKTSCTKSQV